MSWCHLLWSCQSSAINWSRTSALVCHVSHVTRPLCTNQPRWRQDQDSIFLILMTEAVLPAGISVSQDSSQRSLRVNCQSQTFLHCPGSFDRVQCLMPGSGFMMAGWKSFDHKRHCVREPGVTSRQIKFDDCLTLVLSFLVLLIHEQPRLGWLGINLVESLSL